MLRDPDSVEISRQPKLAHARSLRQATGELVRKCLTRFRGQTKPRVRVRHKDADASVEYARSVEAIDWLVEHSTQTQEEVQWLADQIGEIGSREIANLSLSVGQRRRLGDHFWCDTTVALVEIVEELREGKTKAVKEFSQATADVIASEVWSKVEASRREADGTREVAARRTNSRTRRDRDLDEKLTAAILRPIVEKVVTAAVSTAFAPLDAQLELTLWKLRIVTLMLCPDPYAHKAVLTHCLQPIAKEEISEAAHEQLTQFIRRDIDPVSP